MHISHDDKKGFTNYEKQDRRLLHASSFTGLLIHRLNSSAKDPSSKILATRLFIKKEKMLWQSKESPSMFALQNPDIHGPDY